MKYILSLFLFSLLFACRTDKKLETGGLSVTGNYCKYPDNNFLALPFQLFKNEAQFKSDTLRFSGAVKFKNIPYGKYIIKFKSIYDRQEKIEVEINSKTQDISLCIDQIDYNLTKNHLLIDELKPNEKLKIDFNSFGCFHSEKSGLEITRTDSQYLAKMEGTEIVLSAIQIKLVREFEIELREIRTGFCTTSDTYNLNILNSNKNIELMDVSCNWNGFSNLLKKLGLENNYS